MAWTQRPTRRGDLAFEGRLDLDGSGSCTGDWIETSGIETLRVTVRFNNYSGSPGLTVQEGIHVDGMDSSGGPHEIRSHQLTVTNGRAYVEIDLSGRFFRFVASGGGTNEIVYLVARSVS